MGPRQVPRAALQVAALIALLVPAGVVTARPGPPPKPDLPLAVVVDVRASADDLADERSDLVRAIAAEGPRVIDVPAPAIDPAIVTLALAAQRFGELDCTAASAAAVQAIEVLSTRLAVTGVSDDVRAGLRRAWTYRLLCGERASDPAAMQRAASALRNLGVVNGTEVGIAAATWARVPVVDASTDREIVELAVEVVDDGSSGKLPPGSTLWIDHAQLAATADGRWFVPAGVHGVAVRVGGEGATGGSRIDIEIDDKHRSVLISVDDLAPAAASVAAQAMRAAIRAAANPDASTNVRRAALLLAMDAVGATRAVLLRSASAVEIWRRDESGGLTKTATTPMTATLIADALVAIDAPEAPTVVAVSPGGAPQPKTRWWVYATLAGAIAISTTVLLVAGSGEDTQRIEVRGP